MAGQVIARGAPTDAAKGPYDGLRAVGYARVSTDKEDQLNSLETQNEFFGEFAAKHGMHLTHIYPDEGISGTKTRNREQFNRMMADAERDLFDIVLVKDFSRLARNTVDLLQATRRLKALGIEVIFVTYNYTILENSEFIVTIHGAIAQEESGNISKRIKFSKKINAEKGRVPNQVYGYDKIPGNYFDLAINGREAEVVRRIFATYTRHGLGTNLLAQQLNDEGARTKRGKRWSQNAVCRILKNPIYIGKIINNKEVVEDFLTGARKKNAQDEWFVVDRPHLALVDEEVFFAAQALLADRAREMRVGKSRSSSRHLFSTIIKCADCGYSFRRFRYQYKNEHVKWYCSGRHGKTTPCANASSVDEGELIQTLEAYFAELVRRQDEVLQNVRTSFQAQLRAGRAGKASASVLESKLEKAARARTRCMEMYEDALISRDELREKMTKLNEEIAALERSRKLCESDQAGADRLEAAVRRTIEQVRRAPRIENMTNAQLKRAIDRIVVSPDGAVDIYISEGVGLDQTFAVGDVCT